MQKEIEDIFKKWKFNNNQTLKLIESKKLKFKENKMKY